jgi:hypothetical protein
MRETHADLLNPKSASNKMNCHVARRRSRNICHANSFAGTNEGAPSNSRLGGKARSDQRFPFLPGAGATSKLWLHFARNLQITDKHEPSRYPFRMNLKPRLFAIAFACALPTFGQVRSTDECKQYLQSRLPGEASQAPAPKKWPECNSYKLYSGIGTRVDYAAARQCAWSERLAQLADLQPRYTTASLFGGSAMLTVLYANGEGVDQNKNLALRFACESELSDSGIQDIERLPAQPHIIQKKFRFCDEAMTTFEMNFCASYDSEIAAQVRKDSLEILEQKWPQKDRDAFNFLQKASEEYIEAHGRGEVYQGGTIRSIRTNGVEEHQRDKFLEAIRSFERGRLPKATQPEFERADADLNATYKKTLTLAAAQDFKNDDGLIKTNGIRDAERAWLKYRDAWIDFAHIHYPNTDRNAWLTLINANRVWSLRWTMCEVGWNDPSCKPR